jgi:hypothetical protein
MTPLIVSPIVAMGHTIRGLRTVRKRCGGCAAVPLTRGWMQPPGERPQIEFIESATVSSSAKRMTRM